MLYIPPVNVVPEKFVSEPPVANVLPLATVNVPLLVKEAVPTVAVSLSPPVVVKVPELMKFPPVVNLLPLPVVVKPPLLVNAPGVVKTRPPATVNVPVDAFAAKFASPFPLL